VRATSWFKRISIKAELRNRLVSVGFGAFFSNRVEQAFRPAVKPLKIAGFSP
jgi:hypothetical protein